MNSLGRTAFAARKAIPTRGGNWPPVPRPFPPALTRPSTLEWLTYSLKVEYTRWIGRTFFVFIPGYYFIKGQINAPPPKKVYPGQFQDSWKGH